MTCPRRQSSRVQDKSAGEGAGTGAETGAGTGRGEGIGRGAGAGRGAGIGDSQRPAQGIDTDHSKKDEVSRDSRNLLPSETSNMREEGNKMGWSEEEEEKKTREMRKGRLLLLLVACLWGTYGVLARYVFTSDHPPPVSIFTFIRKFMAASSFFVLQPFLQPTTENLNVGISLEKEPHMAAGASMQGQALNRDVIIPGYDEEFPDLPGISENERRLNALEVGIVSASTPVLVSETQPNWQRNLPPVFLSAFELGLWGFLGTGFQALGLELTSATRAGFVVQMTNVIVPVMSSLAGDSVSGATWLAATLAMTGVVTMGFSNVDMPEIIALDTSDVTFTQQLEATDKVDLGSESIRKMEATNKEQQTLPSEVTSASSVGDLFQAPSIMISSDDAERNSLDNKPNKGTGLNSPDKGMEGGISPGILGPVEGAGSLVGDLEVLLGAVFYSLSTVRLSRHLKHHSPYALAAASMTAAAAFAGTWVAFDVARAEASGAGAASLFQGWVDQPGIWLAIVASALGSGTLASLAQTYGQRVVPPTQAQVFYSMQPLFSSVLAMIFVHESLPPLGWVGGILVILASFISK